MVFVIGEVFQDNLKSDRMDEVLNTLPLPIAFKLSDAGYNVNLSTRFKDSEELNLLKEKLASHHIYFNQFDDTDSYTLDDWNLEVVYDMFENDTLLLFSNLGDDTIKSMASYSHLYDCNCLLYINKLFIDKSALDLMAHCFIEEQYVQGYYDDIPRDRFTIIPHGASANEASEMMFSVIKGKNKNIK